MIFNPAIGPIPSETPSYRTQYSTLGRAPTARPFWHPRRLAGAHAQTAEIDADRQSQVPENKGFQVQICGGFANAAGQQYPRSRYLLQIRE